MTGLESATDEMLDRLRDLVALETPSGDADLARAFGQRVEVLVRELLGLSATWIEVGGMPHLLCSGNAPRIGVLCHMDTVWPEGTVDRWPFEVSDGRATGPGVFDMKAGIVQCLYGLAFAGGPDNISLLFTSDEEIGSPTSRAVIEDFAKTCEYVLVMEPSADGALKTGRKGYSEYVIRVKGKAAHAGMDLTSGSNALMEAAHQILACEALSNEFLGTTVTPTVVRSGDMSNVVPDTASVTLDVRTLTLEEQQRVDAGVHRLASRVSGCALETSGGPNRPPLEPHTSAGLFQLANKCWADMGLAALEQATVGGASDGNLTAAIGIPTLDGLGAVGGNAHAEGEFIHVREMSRRAELFGHIVNRLRHNT